MSNVKKPEPVAVICDTYELRYVSCDPVTFIINRTGAKIGSRLITTDQAEAYKDACVREALEQAAKKPRSTPFSWIKTDGAIDFQTS